MRTSLFEWSQKTEIYERRWNGGLDPNKTK
jgi:hypothetical protein